MIHSFFITVLFVGLFVFINGKQIATPQGEIEGVTKTTLKGRQFEAYLGIPFAKPPIGDLRFRSPEPLESWTGIRDGSKDGSVCVQSSMFDHTGTAGSEDCLYLNVFTPSTSKPKQFPVMVFIHGGGFVNGGASMYSPDYLLDKDIVLVVIQYRLGSLGYASTEDEEMPGNYGMKDQVEALKWMQRNIAAYGGDPNSVTIFGESAGGASVHYLMVSPLAKGLFHRAIPMSGTSHCPWATRQPGTVAERTKALAAFVGCPNDTSKAIVTCLRNYENGGKLMSALTSFLKWENDPIVAFTPVVESTNVKDAFLTELPHKLKTSIPMMTGVTADEGVLRLAIFHQTGGVEKRLKELDEGFEEIAPIIFYFDDTAENPREEAQKLRKYYFGDKTINSENKMIISELFTDLWFSQCATSAIRQHTGPTYLYEFGYRGTHSLTHFLSGTKEYLGVCHGDEMIYLIPPFTFVPDWRNLNDDELKQVDELVSLWTNFAIHGNPTPSGSKVKWNPTTPEEMNYLFIDNTKTRMKKKFFSEKDRFLQTVKMRHEYKPIESKSKHEL